MGCNCGKGGRKAGPGAVDNTLGYQVTLPSGLKVPPDGEAPFMSVIEAKVVQRQAGGGTIRRLVKPADGAA